MYQMSFSDFILFHNSKNRHLEFLNLSPQGLISINLYWPAKHRQQFLSFSFTHATLQSNFFTRDQPVADDRKTLYWGQGRKVSWLNEVLKCSSQSPSIKVLCCGHFFWNINWELGRLEPVERISPRVSCTFCNVFEYFE